MIDSLVHSNIRVDLRQPSHKEFRSHFNQFSGEM
jgi:hypothetical protein